MVLEPESPNIMFIESYSTRGFTISGDLVVGPCAVLPRSILQWNVSARRRGGRCRSRPRSGAAPLSARRVPAGWLPPGHLARESVAVPAAGAPDRYAGRGLPPFGLLSRWLCGSHRYLQRGQVWAQAAPMPPCPPFSCLVAEILVLGTGDRVERLHPATLKQMRECGIAVEVQDTANACATFNFLMNERRVVAAGLIPPRGTYGV
ncbi:hypothetical protein DV515_00009804 [Chloebia gouldiae]|uniref:NADH dehydrogenase [ubiquinone] 1 alpha subcomplex assembly factor 3 n=2 Tax=Passeriformes TaxID=9126 RepID=A0A3L8SC01_CHLGU|nr:hypothetical protein DV515_00009804 [Chloebia gouldiae]